MSSIVLTGLSANDPTPGNYLQINFAAGPASGAGLQRTILLVGNPSPAGTAAASTVYGTDTNPACQTEADVIALMGTGSELHRMWLRSVAVNTATSIYLLTVAQSSGVQASITHTLLTVPTASGTWTMYLNDESVQYSFASGDTLATTTAGMVLAINAQSRWPVTAAQATVTTANDSVLITARQKGPRGNFISTQNSLTANVTMTVTNTTRAFLTSGATADSNTSALAAIAANRYDYIVSSAEDATQFGALVTQVNTQALPLTGIRQRCFAGGVDSSASNLNTIAIAQNSAPAEIIAQKSSDWTPAEIAAHAAGVYALLENSGNKPRHNFSLFPTATDSPALWKLPAPRSAVTWSSAEVRSLLANGVTPIGRLQNGKSFIWKRITTRSTNGSVNDYRIREAHKVCEMFFFADDLQAKFSLQFGGKDIVNDPAQGAPPVDGQTVSPANIRSCAQTLVTEYGNSNRFQNAAAINTAMVVQRETSPTTRASVRVPCQVVDILDQIATALDQIG
jgi:phage tail sheath gpL-like